jgi:hypothetical protein
MPAEHLSYWSSRLQTTTGFSCRKFSKDDPHGRWIHLEKPFLPDTALETARLYRYLLDIRPRENGSPDAIINRVTKARAVIIETAQDSEIRPDILLARRAARAHLPSKRLPVPSLA